MSVESFESGFPGTLSPGSSSEASGIVSQAQSNAAATLSSALAYINGIRVPEAPDAITATFTPPEKPALHALPAPPSSPVINFTAVDIPQAPMFPPLVVPDVSAAINIDAPVKPSFLSYPQPGALVASLPDQPVVLSPEIPEAPTLIIPDLPTLLEISVPVAPELVVPSWVADRPENPYSMSGAPTNVEALEVHMSTLADTVRDKVLEVLRDGHGIPAHIEQQIWERAREREEQAGSKLIQETVEEFASRGFAIPPGAMAAKTAEIRHAVHEKVTTLSRDVAIKAVDTQLEAFKVGMAQGIAYEHVYVDASKATAGYALEAAKATVQFGVAMYEAAVRSYAVDVEAYNAEARVFGERIKALAAQADLYRMTVEAAKVKGELNHTMALVFGEQIKAAMAQAELYKARMEGAKAQIEVNLGEIQAFKALTEGYASTVAAKKSEYEAWGEAMKVNSYISQSYTAEVQGYSERIRAATAASNLSLAHFDAQARRNETLARQYIAQIEGLKALVSSQTTLADARSRIFAGEAAVFASQGQAVSSMNHVEVASYAAQGEVNKGVAQVTVAAADASVKNMLVHGQLAVEASSGAAKAAASMAAGAMSAIHAGVSINTSMGTSMSRSWNSSAQVSENSTT